MDFLGLDIGSTTAKAVLVRGGKVIYQKYDRHFSRVRERARELVEEVRQLIGGERVQGGRFRLRGPGAGGGGGVFVQEVFATSEVVKRKAPETDCVIELGGEDAKIIFFDGGIDQRMNGTCAGGTGAFIDQMATLLNVSVGELDALQPEP